MRFIFTVQKSKKIRLTVLLSNLLSILFFNCSRYPQVELSKNVATINEGRKAQINKIDELLRRYRSSAVNEKGYPAPVKKINTIYYKRYFASPFSFSLLKTINDMGIEYSLKGMYHEAEILFNEVLREDKSFSPAFNNLGVIYELNNNYDKAFEMYSKACILESGNKFYSWNFLYFCDKKSNHN